MAAVRCWLARYSWGFVTAQNASLRTAKGALHRPTSDGYEITRTFRESRHPEPMPLEDAVELCRQRHRMAPFCFYNGNTFAAIVRDVISLMDLPPQQAVIACAASPATSSRAWRLVKKRKPFASSPIHWPEAARFVCAQSPGNVLWRKLEVTD